MKLTDLIDKKYKLKESREDDINEFVRNDSFLQNIKKEIIKKYKDNKKVLQKKALDFNSFAVSYYDYVVNDKIEKPLDKDNTKEENINLLRNKYIV